MKPYSILMSLMLVMCILHNPAVALQSDNGSQIQDLSPVMPVGEELVRDGVPQRFWGVNVNIQPWNNAESIDSMASRIKQVGFNAVRLWPNWKSFYGTDVRNSKYPPKQGFNFSSYKKGDGSQLDLFDRMVFACRQNGLSIYMTSLMYYPPIYADSEYVDLVDTDEQDKGNWIEAINDKRWEAGAYSSWWGLHYFDERFQAIWMKHASLFLNHVNQYTGLRNADDNNIVMWQLHNESRFFEKFMLNNEYRFPSAKSKAFPIYFQTKLRDMYNDFLVKKYSTSEKLIEAWGVLLPGENLKLRNIDAGARGINNKKYKKNRVKDFTEFVSEFVNNWNFKYTKFIRGHADSKGVAVTSISTDTFGWTNLPHYSSMYKGSMTAFGNYPNPQFKRSHTTKTAAPWTLKLKFTGAWGPFDFTRPYGKPVVIYETNYNQFSMYDSELPWLLALFSSWQNINGVFFYFWNAPYPDEQSASYGENKFAYRGMEIWGDKVFTAAIHAAGEAYLKRLLPTATNPTVFSFHENVVTDPDWKDWNYTGKFGTDLRLKGFDVKHVKHLRKYIVGSAFKNGARVGVTRDQNFDLVVSGPKVTKSRLYNDIQFGDGVAWNGTKEALFIDLPKIKVFVGLINDKDIIWSEGISIKNLNLDDLSEGALHDPFVAISIVSLDDKPLTISDNIHLFAHSHSFNNNMRLSEKGVVIPGKGRDGKVVTRKLEGDITIPFRNKKKVLHRDFSFNVMRSHDVETTFSLFYDAPIYDTIIMNE